MLAACGGGSGGGTDAETPVTTAGTFTLSGSVGGTTIIAMSNSGDILATDDTAGRARDIDTDGDGNLDAFSFTLTGLPRSQAIRVYLVTGGGIYPMYFDGDNDGTPDSNVFTMGGGSTGDLALGFVVTNTQTGRAIPSNNPAEDGDVTANGAVAGIPVGINSPLTAGLTVAELNARGENALRSGWALGARTYYEAAVDLAANSSGNDADTARFMFALTRVAALGFDTLSDGSPDDMGRLGDLLDLFDFADDETRGNWTAVEAPATLPADAPAGNDIRDFAYDVVRPELQAAAANLDDVSAAFANVFTHEGETVDVDHGDALFFSGLLRSMVANIQIQRAYELDVDIDDAVNNDRTIEDVRAMTSHLLGQPDLTVMAEAKASVNAALADMKAAIDSISAEADDQADDLITIDATVDTVQWKAWIDQTLASIAGTSTDISTAALDLQRFFDSGVVLDDTTLPGNAGNGIDPADAFFDDPTMGGVILDTDTDIDGVQDINKDTGPWGMPDGIPDILQFGKAGF